MSKLTLSVCVGGHILYHLPSYNNELFCKVFYHIAQRHFSDGSGQPE